MNRKGRVVLYFPMHNDPASGYESSKDLLPLSVLQIAGLPDAEGYEVVVIDGNLYSQEEAHRRVVEACRGALIYGTSGILGFQVADGYLCSQKVRAAHPDLPMVIGGWFASVTPEMQLATGLYDAVALGQGEITFLDLVHAADAGEPFDSVPGLALLRDGEVVRTEHRRVVGWKDLPNAPWHLLDIEPYREAQLRGTTGSPTERMPTPPGFAGRPFFGISYFSSFGCPEPCTFCCSPEVTGLRWKSLPGKRMADELMELKDRWGFDTVRFHDANWGVAEKRTREFCDTLIEAGSPFWFYAMMQAFSILRYKPETLDAMRDAGMYSVGIGGETGDADMLVEIGKHTKKGENLRAAIEIDKRDIGSWVTYIIGFPGETEESMMNTIEECREITVACDLARPTVWPFRPIPGTASFRKAVEQGYEPPADVLSWGRVGQFHLDETWRGKIPPTVARARKLFEHYYTLSLGIARGRVGFWEKRARRRLSDGSYRSGALEAKAFSLYHRVANKLLPRGGEIHRGHMTSSRTARANA